MTTSLAISGGAAARMALTSLVVSTELLILGGVVTVSAGWLFAQLYAFGRWASGSSHTQKT